MRDVWTPSTKCSRPGCVMTLTTTIGGRRVCWFCALMLGIPVDLRSGMEQRQ